MEVDEGPSELRLSVFCFLTPLSSISINLYYVLYNFGSGYLI